MKPRKQEKPVIDANNHLCTDMDGLFDLLRTDDGSLILYENGQRDCIPTGLVEKMGQGLTSMYLYMMTQK